MVPKQASKDTLAVNLAITAMSVTTDLEFQTVYNTLSFTLASMATKTLHLGFRSYAVNDKYKSAGVISGLVTVIAACRHMSIVNF